MIIDTVHDLMTALAELPRNALDAPVRIENAVVRAVTYDHGVVELNCTTTRTRESRLENALYELRSKPGCSIAMRALIDHALREK
jgi:hypothetical protein